MVEVFASLILIGVVLSCQASSCPPDQLLYETDGKCYAVGVGFETPCANELQFYSEVEGKPGHGSCTCLPSVGKANRPVAKDQQSNQCFMVFDQGPCNKGDWFLLIKSEKTIGVCAKRTCPDDEEKNGDNFWFEHNGVCLQAETSNLEFCGNERDKILFDSDKPEPVCMEPIPNGRGYRGLMCPPGYKELYGQCKRIVQFG